MEFFITILLGITLVMAVWTAVLIRITMGKLMTLLELISSNDKIHCEILVLMGEILVLMEKKILDLDTKIELKQNGAKNTKKAP